MVNMEALFARNVPHILEMIFLSLDYQSLKACLNVGNTWREHLKSESFQRRAKSVFANEISYEEEKIWDAVKCGRADELRRILSGGMVDVKLVKSPTGSKTLLTEAAWKGHTNVVRVLLEEGADANKADHYDRTPLIVAATSGYEDMARLLLDGGAKTYLTDKDGWTPLNKAAYWDHIKVVKLLLKNHLKSLFGDSTPLIEAAWKGHTNVM